LYLPETSNVLSPKRCAQRLTPFPAITPASLIGGLVILGGVRVATRR